MWRPIALLTGVSAAIVLATVGLARITLPDVDAEAEAPAAGEDLGEFMPTLVGGELTVTGAREGTIVLERNIDGPSYGLGNDQARIFFDSNPPSISQMSYDGLQFFPDPEDCTFTPGQHNQEIGLAVAIIDCPALEDVRGNGTIAMTGYVAAPADLVLDLDLPETGGTIMVGDETWEIASDQDSSPVLFIGPGGEGGAVFQEGQIGLFLEVVNGPDLRHRSVFFGYDGESDRLTLQGINLGGANAEVSPGACDVETELLVQINPQASIEQLTFSCDPIGVAGMGSVPISGTVTFEKIYFFDP